MNSDIDYAPVDLTSLQVDLPLAGDLYIKDRGRYIPYREASLPFTAADRQHLLASGVSCLWVRISTADSVQRQQRLAALLAAPDEELPAKAKARLLYRWTTDAAGQTIAGLISETMLADADLLVCLTLDYLRRSQVPFSALLSVMLEDLSPHTWAMNVAVYALALGRFMGMTDNQVLNDLGIAAMTGPHQGRRSIRW